MIDPRVPLERNYDATTCNNGTYIVTVRSKLYNESTFMPEFSMEIFLTPCRIIGVSIPLIQTEVLTSIIIKNLIRQKYAFSCRFDDF